MEWRLQRRRRGLVAAALAVREDFGLEGAELGYPREAREVAAVGQLTVARRADQPAMLRPVEAAMEDVVELGAGDRLAIQGEDPLMPQQGH